MHRTFSFAHSCLPARFAESRRAGRLVPMISEGRLDNPLQENFLCIIK
jgi:hypothetical protein